jgi:predicted FMN-binding regulatory protein PaiB
VQFNHLHIERVKNTIFVALPADVGNVIPGGCWCEYCKAHPDKVPTWDTLVIDAGRPSNKRRETTTLCHYPELPR